MTMSRTTRSAAIGLVMLLGASMAAGLGPVAAAQQAARPSLPARLTDAAFWTLVSDISEPGGFFRIVDNYTSNEREVGQLVTMLRERNVRGGVYVGVGPEQNFSYIAATRPAMAFICDIRRQAVMQHLMFKAVFEMAKDRAEFISILFARPRPEGIGAAAPIQAIWNAYYPTSVDMTAAEKHKARIVERLTKTHKFTFTPEESGQLNSVYDAFVSYGPAISTRGSGGGNTLTFADLTGWMTDAMGRPQSFLATDEDYQFVKTLHEQNLIVPVSGDFGGPKAIRAIGDYVTKAGAVVNAFYVSNVEQYLFQDGKNRAFFENVATFPVNDASVFIRPYSLRRYGSAAALCAIGAFLGAAKDGRVYSNNDALACVR